ncbi:MAG: DUF4251 domain-containing protein [Bacteroidetes bacterium]|nr:DUF4251 domain-containing protein [Bacteroidota bacterium]
MSRICVLVVCLVFSAGLYSQEQKSTRETKQEASQRKKEEREAKMEKQFRQTDSLLKARRFVLEAHFLKPGSGDRIPVSSTLNFISVDSVTAMLQIGSFQRVGVNGAGGITEPGKISRWNLEKDDKRKNFYLTMTIRGDYNTYDVSMNIDYAGNSDATLTGIRMGSLMFEGNVVSEEETVIFRGQKH